jgi:hypothetical protein
MKKRKKMITTIIVNRRIESTEEFLQFLRVNKLNYSGDSTYKNLKYIALITTPEVYSEDHEDIVIKSEFAETIIKLDSLQDYICVIFPENCTYTKNKHFNYLYLYKNRDNEYLFCGEGGGDY